MLLDLDLPNTVGNAFGPDFRLVSSFLLAADPLGHLLVWLRAVVAVLVAGLALRRWVVGVVVPAVVAVKVVPAAAAVAAPRLGVAMSSRRG
jgi:hypothetical protein